MEKDEFTHPYLGLTKKERKEMLEYLGLTSADELFSDIPIRSEFHMEEQPLSEQELFFEFYELSKRNWNYLEHPLFAGGWGARPLCSCRGSKDHRKGRVSHVLHALPARDNSRDATGAV